MQDLIAVILAAGEGKRMKSKNSKVTHKACGRALVEWVVKAVDEAGIKESVVVVGHRADQVRECLGDKVCYAEQATQLGTGHAVMQAEKYLKGRDGYVFVLNGDAPLITSDTISKTIEFHRKNKYSATVLTAEIEDPTGYGRILRNDAGDVCRIVEHKDASSEERAVKEINSGMYCFTIKDLLQALAELSNDNSQGEYYLTDTLEILIHKGLRVGAVKVENTDEILGINDKLQLSQIGEIFKKRILRRNMLSGVSVMDAATTYIDDQVEIGMDTVIYPGTILEGNTKIGEGCIIGPASRLVNAEVGDDVEISQSVVLDSCVEDGAKIGPFAYIRPESRIGKKVKIGDFVEIKKSVIGDKTKIPHLAYIGDSQIGRNTNIACGVITVNYDGKKKHKTVIGDNCFIGCNTNLVAPVTVNDNSYVAAGSTITEEVPEYSLAIARSRQVNKEDWVRKKGMERKEKD